MPSRDVGFNALNSTDYALAAGSVRVMPLPVRGTQDIDSITVRVNTTNAGAKMKGLIFARNAATGRPGALLHTSDEVTGVTAGIMVLPFTVKPSLANGLYIFGVISDTAINLRGINGANLNFIDATGSYAVPPASFDAAAAVQTTRVSLGYRYTSDGSEYAYTRGYLDVTGWATANREVNRKDVYKFTAQEDVTITKLTIMWAGGGGLTSTQRLLIHAHDAGANQPAALLGASDEGVGMPFGVHVDYTFSTPVALTAGTTYWIGHHNGGAVITMYYLDAVGEARSTTWDTYADGSISPFTASGGIGNDDFHLPISYEYTPAAATPGTQPYRRPARWPQDLTTGNTQGWTVPNDGTSQWFSSTSSPSISPPNGNAGLLSGNNSNYNYLYYDDPILDQEVADVDAGLVTAKFYFTGTTLDADDEIAGFLEALDGSGAVLATTTTGTLLPNTGTTFVEYAVPALVLPMYTRKVRYRLFGRKRTGVLSDRRNAISGVRGWVEADFDYAFAIKAATIAVAGPSPLEGRLAKAAVVGVAGPSPLEGRVAKACVIIVLQKSKKSSFLLMI